MSVFPAVFLARAISKLLTKNSYEVIPTSLMPSCFVSVRKIEMHKGHECSLSLFLEGHGYFRFFSRSVRRHPGMLHSARPLELRKSAVMGRPLKGPVEEP